MLEHTNGVSSDSRWDRLRSRGHGGERSKVSEDFRGQLVRARVNVKGHIWVSLWGSGFILSGAGARLVAAFMGGGGIVWGGAVTGAEICGDGISHLE